ncbi:CheY-like superfamily [Geranomyces variabilis]|nr:CheY-like superfamily [Geranomyces variabilis]
MSDDQRLYIKTLEQSCAQLLSVIGRMQDLAALQQDTPITNIIPFDIVGIITGVAESVQRMSIHGRHGTLVALDLDPELPLSIDGDLTKLQQILINLVGIATTSSLTKHALLKAKFEALNDKQAKIHFVITGAHTQTPKSLLDGLDHEFSFNDLFQPLTSNNLSQGIVICQEFLKHLGSHLELEIATDDTLIFRFSMDVTYNKKAVARDYEGELRGARSAVRILVAEDNRVSQRIAIAMLNKLGFMDVDAVENGQEAIDKLEQKPYDVILMVGMPVLDGYDAACHIRTVLKNTTVIIVALTANSTNTARQRCIAAGMDDYFTKPITIKTLTEMLHKWL